jgi:hypothetical protein
MVSADFEARTEVFYPDFLPVNGLTLLTCLTIGGYITEFLDRIHQLFLEFIFNNASCMSITNQHG